MTTVGYGDRYPTTSEGRLIATVLMVAGVGIFGMLSGLVASWFLSPASKAAEAEREEIKQLLIELRDRRAAEDISNGRRSSIADGVDHP
jgi:voltage-gated potassium channel